MDYGLSMEQEILRKSVRDFAEKEIRPVAAELDEKETFSYDTMKKMAELGLFGMFVSEKYGGQGMGLCVLYHCHRGDCPGGRFPCSHRGRR